MMGLRGGANVSIIRFLIVLVLVVPTGCVLTGQTASSRAHERAMSSERGMWVTRWDFASEADVRRAIADADSIGITDVYFQVRGQGDAYYESELEPWGEELTKFTGPEPGFDPLEVAIDEARVRGVRVHAWMNVMPLWKGKVAPKDPSHRWVARKDWRLTDANGNPQALHDGYVVINPVLEETQDHIVRVVRDIVRRYDVDGIHLDYIRFLSDEIKDEALMPGDAKSRALYTKQTGKIGEAGAIDRVAYRSWIRDRISTLVRRIDEEGLMGKRGVTLSAAVWRRPDLAKDRYLQDAARWVREGWVDTIMPMVYTDDDAQYRADLSAWYAEVDSSRVVPGIGVYKHADPSATLRQIAIGQPRRFALFAYSTMFESCNPDQKKDGASIAARRAHRDAIERLTTRVGAP
jgi:uncharacterized lipoprotein YddW (UPF0748 family)